MGGLEEPGSPGRLSRTEPRHLAPRHQVFPRPAHRPSFRIWVRETSTPPRGPSQVGHSEMHPPCKRTQQTGRGSCRTTPSPHPGVPTQTVTPPSPPHSGPSPASAGHVEPNRALLPHPVVAVPQTCTPGTRPGMPGATRGLPGRWGRAVNSGRRASAAHTHPPFGQQDASPDDAPWPRSWARQGEEEKGRTSLKLELTTVPAPGARGAQTAPALFAAARLAPPGLHICGMSCS